MPINNSTLPSREEFLKRKKKERVRKYSVISLLIVLIVGVFSYLSHRPELRVTKVILKGGVLVTESDISEKSTSFMKGSYIFLFPKNGSLWYPKHKLENYLKQNFQRIDSISIDSKGLKTIVVSIEERKPFAIWCDSLLEAKDVSTTTQKTDKNPDYQKCYFIDQNSTIFSESPYFSGDAYFKFYGLVSTTTPIGTYYIASSTEFEEITSFIDKLRSMSIRPSYLVANESGDYSLTVSGGGKILFDTKKPLVETAKNLESLLRTPALSTSTNADLPIEYIDLRYGNKLFYKLKNE